MCRAQPEHKQEKNENVCVWKNRYTRLCFKTCKGLVCIVHQTMDGSWGHIRGSVASSGQTLCPLLPAGVGVSMKSDPLCFLTATAQRKGLVCTQGNAVVFSTQFLLCVVGSGLCILVLVLNEVPATEGWVLGRMERWHQSSTQNLMTVVTGELHCAHFSPQRRQRKEHLTLDFPAPLE